MINVTIIYQLKNIVFQSNTMAKIKIIKQKFCQKIKADLDSILFLYKGNALDENLSLETLFSENKEKDITILAYEINKENPNFHLSKDIICSCGEITNIRFDDYNLELYMNVQKCI